MISTLAGILTDRSGESIVLQTEGGVGYQVTVPLGVLERLPALGQRCLLHTELVVREDGWALFGFDTPAERQVFRRLLTASGFGPRLAIATLSTLGPDRTVKCIQTRDIAALSTVSGIGKKKAERLVLELHDRFRDVAMPTGDGTATALPVAEEALRGLEALGYSGTEATTAIRAVLQPGDTADTPTIIRRALLHLTSTRGGTA